MGVDDVAGCLNLVAVVVTGRCSVVLGAEYFLAVVGGVSFMVVTAVGVRVSGFLSPLPAFRNPL